MDIIWKKAAIYYGAAIFFSWTAWIGTIVLASANNIDIIYNEGFFKIFTEGAESAAQLSAHLVFTAATYGPLFGALIVRLWMKGKRSKGVLQDSTIRSKPLKLNWLLLIAVYPLVLFPVALGLSFVLTGFSGEFQPLGLPIWFFVIFFVFQCLTSGIEEFGWRGYLQPLLQTKYKAEKSCYIVGILWSVWHYPFIIFINQQNGLWMTLLMLAGFTLLTVPQAFVLGWLYNSTRNVFLCVIFHAWSNTVAAYLLVTSSAPQVTPIVVAVMTWLIASYLVKKYGKENLRVEGN